MKTDGRCVLYAIFLRVFLLHANKKLCKMELRSSLHRDALHTGRLAPLAPSEIEMKDSPPPPFSIEPSIYLSIYTYNDVPSLSRSISINLYRSIYYFICLSLPHNHFLPYPGFPFVLDQRQRWRYLLDILFKGRLRNSFFLFSFDKFGWVAGRKGFFNLFPFKILIH